MMKIICVIVFYLQLVAVTQATDFNSCELPSNNTQRVHWLNQLVVETQQILSSYQISSWISQGTLLGSVRDNQTLPWTGDSDVHAFATDTQDLCNRSNRIADEFRTRDLRIYDCRNNFLRVCFANVSMRPAPIFLERDKFAPEAKLELYGCTKRPDGLYTITDSDCIWNFTGLFPLKRYRLGEGVYALGPNRPIYWIEQYFGKGWRKPVYYSGDVTLDNICVGQP